MRYLAILLLCLIPSVSWCAEPDPAEKWKSEIEKMAAATKESAPAKGGIMFVGSSSIRLWNASKWFPERAIINHGFGGSQTSDVNYWFDQLVTPWQPQHIVFYCGDNDIAKNKSPETVLQDFKTFLGKVRQNSPGATVYYLPIKPSVKRWEMWDTMSQVNTAIQQLAAESTDLNYLDTATPLLNSEGLPDPIYFQKDGLHLTDKGYELWSAVVEKALP